MLTKKQKDVLVYIKAFIEENDVAPSLEEIRSHFKLASPSTADYYVKKLIDDGYLSRPKNRARSIELKRPDSLPSAINYLQMKSRRVVFLVGTANAGEALDWAEEQFQGHVEVPDFLSLHKELFALRVNGDSMENQTIRNKKILNGSIVFIDPSQKTPQTGDIVLSIINGCANIKKIVIDSKNGVIKLMPNSDNEMHKPIFLTNSDDFIVNGKVVGIV